MINITEKPSIFSLQNIAEAIHSVSTEAKVQRDLQLNSFLATFQLNKIKLRKVELYKIKTKSLKKLIQEHHIVPIGFHALGSIFGVYYEINEYSYHLIRHKKPDNLKYLGKIEGNITSNKKGFMTFSKAEELLNSYLKGKN